MQVIDSKMKALKTGIKDSKNILALVSLLWLNQLPAFSQNTGAQDANAQAGMQNQVTASPDMSASTKPLSDAEKWVRDRLNPGAADSAAELKKKKRPVRSFIKSVAKGAAKELGTSADDMAKDMVFVFSVQDIDPYDKTKPPVNKQAIVLEFTMVDGSIAYLHRFPDGSFAIENGFANGTVMVPDGLTTYVIKYPNGVNGRVVRQKELITIYRPDKTITTVKMTSAGGYTMSNSKFGYMGEARPDSTGDQYELGAW